LRGSSDPDIAAGRQLFSQANCQSCHGGPQWTSGRVRYNPPPDATLISNGQLIAELRKVGTFNAQDFNEVRQNAAPAIGADGFVPPSLLSLFAFPQTFLHGGGNNTLDLVMANVAHRSAGTGTDTLTDATKRAQLIKFILSIDAVTVPISPNPPTTVTVTSAAWSTGNKVAPDSIASGYGTGLATLAGLPSALPLPVAVNGTTVAVTDANGVPRLGQLFYVGPLQVNFTVPTDSVPGSAAVTVTGGDGSVATGNVVIAPVVPSIFVAPGGTIAAGSAVRVGTNGTQTPLNIVLCAATCTATPIDLGAATDVVTVTFFGTGVRRASSLANVQATIGGVAAPVAFAGPQGQFVGLDQINVQLPAALRGRGLVPVVFTVDGQTSNTVMINVL
jgi:uncharacterized protein (TIGR03437 family)